MDRVLSWSSFEERASNPALAYWLTRPPEERIAEVERLRREYGTVFRETGDMDVHKDFADLCLLLNERGVEDLIVGAYAVAFHGAPCFTGKLDILIAPYRYPGIRPHASPDPDHDDSLRVELGTGLVISGGWDVRGNPSVLSRPPSSDRE